MTGKYENSISGTGGASMQALPPHGNPLEDQKGCPDYTNIRLSNTETNKSASPDVAMVVTPIGTYKQSPTGDSSSQQPSESDSSDEDKKNDPTSVHYKQERGSPKLNSSYTWNKDLADFAKKQLSYYDKILQLTLSRSSFSKDTQQSIHAPDDTTKRKSSQNGPNGSDNKKEAPSVDAKNNAPSPILHPETPQSWEEKFFSVYRLLPKITAIPFLALLLHDLIAYGEHPEERFGTTLTDTLIGTTLSHPTEFSYAKIHLNSWLNHMGSDDVTNPSAYWAGISVFTGISVIEFLVRYWHRKDILSTNIDYPSSLRELGQKIVSNNVSRGIIALFLVAEYCRLAGTLAYKSQKYFIDYPKKEKECETQNKILSKQDSMFEWDCSVCGDFDDLNIPYNDLNNPQACLDSLLAKDKSPESLLRRVERFKNFPGLNIDVSKQAWPTWNEETLEKLFEIFAQMKPMALNLSYPSNPEVPLTQRQVSAIVNLIQKLHLDTFMVTDILLGDNRDQFIYGFNNTYINNLILNSLSMGDEGVETLEQVMPTIQGIQTVGVENNGLSDTSFTMLRASAPDTVYDMNFNYNKITSDSLLSAKNKNQRALNIAGMYYGDDGIAALNAWVPNVQTKVNLANSGLVVEQLVEVKFHPELQKLILSGNDFSSAFYTKKFFHNLPRGIKELTLTNTQLPKGVGEPFAAYIRDSLTTKLVISDNEFVTDDFRVIAEAVCDSQVEIFDLSKSYLSNEHADILSDVFKSGCPNLKTVILHSNQINTESGDRLIMAMADAGIEVFNIQNNPLEPSTCLTISQAIPDSTFKNIHVDEKSCDGDGVAAVTQSARNNSTLEYFHVSGITLNRNQALDIDRSLINSADSMAYLDKDTLSRDEINHLHKAESATKLKGIFFHNAQIEEDAQSLLLRPSIVPNAPAIEFDVFKPRAIAMREDTSATIVVNTLAGVSVGMVFLYFFLRYLNNRYGLCKHLFFSPHTEAENENRINPENIFYSKI